MNEAPWADLHWICFTVWPLNLSHQAWNLWHKNGTLANVLFNPEPHPTPGSPFSCHRYRASSFPFSPFAANAHWSDRVSLVQMVIFIKHIWGGGKEECILLWTHFFLWTHFPGKRSFPLRFPHLEDCTRTWHQRPLSHGNLWSGHGAQAVLKPSEHRNSALLAKRLQTTTSVPLSHSCTL